MEIRVPVNTKILEKLNPCKDRFQNWLKHYKTFNGNITEFLALEHITPEDKIWVAVRLMPRDLVETFVIDCASAANAYAATGGVTFAAHVTTTDTISANAADVNAYAAAHANAYAAAYAATNYVDADAAFTATYAAERERQIEALMYLCQKVSNDAV